MLKDIIDVNIILNWLLVHGSKIIAILIVAYILKKISKVTIKKLIEKIIAQDSTNTISAKKKREETLVRIFSLFVNILIIIFTGLMIIQELGFAVGPLLAGAGIAGVALGFGAQYLIKDLISGFFILIENQYRLGDVVCFNDTCGIVEDMSLRTTTLRDLDGTSHCFPHGIINETSNLSKKFGRINLDIGIAYDSDLEKVISVVNKVGKELAEDAEWKEHIFEAPQFLRVENFADSAIIIKILGKTKPIQQWAVTGELRKRIKIAFDQQEIEIPFPQRVIHKK